MSLLRYILFICCLLILRAANAQDIDLTVSKTLLPGQNVIKISRDFTDPYLWALTDNHHVYRINTNTFVVDDYSPKLNAYTGQQWIDIAGAEPEHFFIAINGAAVLEYDNGTVNSLNNNIGINGTVNSIGMDAIYSPDFSYTTSSLGIATSNGLIYYNYKNKTTKPATYIEPSHIYDASYRSYMFHDGAGPRFNESTVTHYSMFEHNNYAIFGEDILFGGVYGTDLRCAYYTRGSMWYSSTGTFTSFANIFYATESGLIQVGWSNNFSTQNYGKYLVGQRINKINSVFGLGAFTNNQYFGKGLGRENLLVGTDAGLYFSNSYYMSNDNSNPSTYTFYHYNQLGVKKINDITPNSNSDQINDRRGSVVACEDGAWVAANDGLYLLHTSYSRYFDETSQIQSIVFLDNPILTVNEKTTCGPVDTKIIVSGGYSFTPDQITWQKDGQDIPDEHGNTLTVNQPGDYYAVINDCSGLHAQTNHLKIIQLTGPVFSFNYPDKINYCFGSTATLQTENNINYQYRWYKDGILNGNTTAVLNTTLPGKYKLEVSACSGSWTPTKDVEIAFIKVPQPTITPDKAAYCIGSIATLSTDFVNDGNYVIDWLRNGIAMPLEQNKTSINTNVAANYSIKIKSKLTTCSQVSNSYNLSFETPPSVSIQRVINTTLCSGQTVDLKATYSGSTINWSTGETTDKISVKNSGTYTATVKTVAGCEVAQQTNVQFFNNPVLSIPDVTLCQFTNDQLTLTAPAGFIKYEWNGQQGSSAYTTNKLGSVTLTVTDQNNCQATQTIHITSHCNDIHIPNTFTPNGDGLNDKWLISGLEGDVTVNVKIYNRNGGLVFESQGYDVPWDGTYNGKKLPSGVYYYVINAKGTKQILSGSITIIY